MSMNGWCSVFVNIKAGWLQPSGLSLQTISFLGLRKEMTANEVPENNRTFLFFPLSLKVLEGGRPTSRCQQGYVPSDGSQVESLLPFSASSGFWHSLAGGGIANFWFCLHMTSALCLCMSQSPSVSFIKTQVLGLRVTLTPDEFCLKILN